ncbi:unnamed protein product, partial [Tetraodon nigroviridis]
VWDETFQRVTNEQEIYEGGLLSAFSSFRFSPRCCCLVVAQLHDLMQLKQENSYLTTITRQISPYILSIAKVKERLEPR